MTKLVFWVVLTMTPAVQTEAARELIGLEQELSDALVRLDASTLDKLWSDDLVFVSPDGRISNKQERLSGLKASTLSSAGVVTAATNDDVKVRLYGQPPDQVAIVTLVSTWKGKENDREYSNRYTTTHIWTSQGRQWRLVSAHVSMTPPYLNSLPQDFPRIEY
jgi:ketosteroid isomerase-like protein